MFSSVACAYSGATKMEHLEEAADALNITLSADEIKALEELYKPHKLFGL
jgi:aryl-alcohol dehydrogenase-like predicted oxidoreductase